MNSKLIGIRIRKLVANESIRILVWCTGMTRKDFTYVQCYCVNDCSVIAPSFDSKI